MGIYESDRGATEWAWSLTQQEIWRERALPLAERVRLLSNRAGSLVEARIRLDLEAGEVRQVEETLITLDGIAEQLDLLGKPIAAFSNGAWYADINTETGQHVIQRAFGVAGLLWGFKYGVIRDSYTYVLDMSPIEVDAPHMEGVVTPKAFSLVAMGGLQTVSARLTQSA